MSDYMQGNPDTGAVSVPFSDDDTEKATSELLEEERPDASPEERKTRRQKQQERLQGMLQKGREFEEKAKKLEERDAQRERELAELRGMLAERRASEQAQRPAGKDPFDAELDAVYARQNEAYNAYQAEVKAGTFNEKRAQYYENVAREIEETKGRILVRKEIARAQPEQQAQAGQRYWVNRYPEVYGNPRAYQYAEATFKRRTALGEQDTHELVEEVLEDARTQFKLGPKKAPTASEKSRMSGVPATGGGGGGQSGNNLSLDPQVRRIAIAAYPELSEADALKAWANKTGKRMREKKVL